MTSEQREIVNRYLATDISYVTAHELLVQSGMDHNIAYTILDAIDNEADCD